MKKEHLVLLGLFLTVLIVYLAFPTKQYYWDGVAFAYTIENAESWASLIHPNHLIYNLVGYSFYWLCSIFRSNIRALETLQILDSVLAAAAVAALGRLIFRITNSLYLAVSLGAMFAFSATWWKFATDANAYTASVLFLLTAFAFVLPDRPARPGMSAVLYAISLCFHQLAVIAFPALILSLWLQPYSDKKRRGMDLILFAGLAFVLTFGAYCIAFYVVTDSVELLRFARWTTSFSVDGGFTFNVIDSLLYSIRGSIRLFFGGRINLLSGLINAQTVFLIAVFIAVCVMIGIQTWLWIKNRRSREPSPSKAWHAIPIVKVFFAWIAIYIVFLFVWLPQNTFYRLFYLPPIILAAAIWIASKSPKIRHSSLTILASAAMAIANFLFLIYPYSFTNKWPPIKMAHEMTSAWPPGTNIVYAVENADGNLFRYVNKGTVWRKTASSVPQQIIQDLKDDGRGVWLDATAIDSLASTDESRAWLDSHQAPESFRDIADPNYNIKFIYVQP